MAKDRKIDMVILGLLSHEDLTGYDIKKRIDQAVSFFWKGSFGSIYPALAVLEKQGLVQKLESAPSGGREKIRYHITDTGITFLKSWLNDTRASNELKYETLLKLFFNGVEDRSVALRNINAFEKQVTDELAFLRMCRGNLEKALDSDDHLYYFLTADFGVEACEAYLKWCARARKMLR